MEELNVKLDVKNIQQYVAKVIITELNKQNQELEKLRHLASKIDHCMVCYALDSYSLNYHYLLRCRNCKNCACDEIMCRKGWLLKMKEYEADYCCEKCYDEDYTIE